MAAVRNRKRWREQGQRKHTQDNKTMQECPSPIFILYQEERGEKKREFKSNSSSKYKINICCFILASNYKFCI